MIYILTFILSLLFVRIAYSRLYRLSKFQFILFSFVAILIPSILAGFRDVNVGTDTQNYLYLFDSAINSRNFLDFLSTTPALLETGFSFIIFLISRITVKSELFLFLIHFVLISIVYIASYRIRSRINPVYAIFVFFLINFNESMNITRQYMSLVIILLSFTYIIEGKIKTSILFVICSILFHSSAVLFFLIYPLIYLTKKYDFNRYRIRYLIVCLCTFLIAVFGFLNSPLYSLLITTDRLSGYLERGNNGLSNSTLVLYSYIMVIAMKGSIQRYKNFDIFAIFSILSLFFLLCSLYTTTLYRLSLVFSVFTCFCIPAYYTYRKKQLLYIVTNALLLIYWIFVIIMRGSYATYPYSSSLLGL